MQPDAGASVTPRTIANGRYRLLAEIGAGELYTVWRARDTVVGTDRALKLLAPTFAAKTRVRQRFEQEARAMARLSHPHAAAVYDVGIDDGKPYVAMELLEGGSTMGWVGRHGPMPPALAVDVLITALAALGAAHAQGVVHRDVKPQNLLLSAGGEVFVADFGLGQVRTVVEGAGVSAFAAPELRDGKPGTARSDVYGAGLTLLTLLIGHVSSDPLADLAVAASPWPELQNVIWTALSTDPAARYASADAMATALEALRIRLPAVPEGTPPLGERVVIDTIDLPESTLRPQRRGTAHDDRGTLPNAPSREASPARGATGAPVAATRTSSEESGAPPVRPLAGEASALGGDFLEIPDAPSPDAKFLSIPPPPPMPLLSMPPPPPEPRPQAPVVREPSDPSMRPHGPSSSAAAPRVVYRAEPEAKPLPPWVWAFPAALFAGVIALAAAWFSN